MESRRAVKGESKIWIGRRGESPYGDNEESNGKEV